MKKFTKICLIASIVLILTGGILCVIAKVSGGFRLVRELERDRWGNDALYSYNWSGLGGSITREILRDIKEDIAGDDSMMDVADDMKDAADEVKNAWGDVKDEVKDASEEVKDAWDDAWDEDWDIDWDDDWKYGDKLVNGTVIPKEYLDTGVTAEEITEMKIGIGGAELFFQESEDNNFGVKLDGKGTYKYYASNGIFYLAGSKKHIGKNFKEKVYVYLPKGKAYKNVEVSVGGGIIRLGELLSDEVDLDIGGGVITADKIDTRSLNLEAGAGITELKGVNADELDITVGAGTVSVAGDVAEKIEAECGMGLIELKLDNSETDFNYELSCLAGNIELGGREYSGLDKEKYINNNVAAMCSLESSMGSIQVSFENSKE